MNTTKYTVYEKEWKSPFEGNCIDTVLVSDTGKVLAHFRGWVNPSVVDDWNPLKDGLVGTNWKDRPRWRKCYQQNRVLGWALDIYKGE